MEYLWALNYLLYGVPLGLELFILWSTFGPWIIYSMEYLWYLNFFHVYLWVLNYLFYGVPLGLELFILWSTFGPWTIYSMEYLWALNYLFYGVPLGLELFILWCTFGPWIIYSMEYLWAVSGSLLARVWSAEVDTRLPYCTMVGISRYPGTPINQFIHIFLMTIMNFTIASNLDPPFVLVENWIGPNGEWPMYICTYVEKNLVFVVGIGSTIFTFHNLRNFTCYAYNRKTIRARKRMELVCEKI